ncbi:MurR/RpiR family transcriptional regulator [Streptomyces pathocidini]|uniref:MurR/RpiR family transcriptional regulator n=1 Tax=Streptomyces pathocidini TaxID=1650571 RepID=UPI0034045237
MSPAAPDAGPDAYADDGIVARVRELLTGLPEAQRALAELVLDDPAAVARMTILDLADACGVSTGSITRFCRTLGLSGYAALRLALAADRGGAGGTGIATWRANMGADISEKDDIQQVAAHLSAAVRHGIERTFATLDLAAVDRTAAALAAARRVEVYGVGGSAGMASEFQQRVYRIGVPAWAWTDAHMALTGAALLGPGDVVVTVSHSGRTREVVDLLTEAVSRGATTVAVTNAADSPLAARADLVLATDVRADGLSHETILARHAQMAVLDLLYVAVAQRTYEKTTVAMAATSEAVQPYKQPESGRG